MHHQILSVRSPFVTFHVLRQGNALYLIDTGFVGGRRLLRRALQERGWSGIPIAGIILTHGHIDHIYNAAAFARDFGAWIAAPRLDANHCAGRHAYRGTARVCGWLESLSRTIFPWKPFEVDLWMDDGTSLPKSGLTAFHLPGHTAGHMGLYHPEMHLLLCGDLVASPARGAILPPAIFNSEPGKIPSSIGRALSLKLEGVVPSHGDDAPPSVHLARLQVLHEKLVRKSAGRVA